MPAALTPELALSYVRELSADVRDGVVLDSSGTRVAGSAGLVAQAHALLGPPETSPELGGSDSLKTAVADDRRLFGMRSAKHSIVVLTGRHAMPAVVRLDLAAVLSRLDSPS